MGRPLGGGWVAGLDGGLGASGLGDEVVADVEDGREMASDEDEAILICWRVVDLPIPYVPAQIRVCTGGCLERVWVAHSSPQDVRPVCAHCAEPIIAADPDPQFQKISDAQVWEVAQWLGFTGRKR